MAKFHSVLWLRGTPLYTTSSLLSVDGHLGFSHNLAIVSNAAVNIGVHVYFQISFFFPDIYLGIELLGHLVVLVVVF